MGVDVAALLRERQNKFIETRTLTESEVDKFFKSLDSLDDDIKDRIKYAEGRTAKSVLPSLWTEPFNQERYSAELAALNNYIKHVHQICDEINAEAIACLQS